MGGMKGCGKGPAVIQEAMADQSPLLDRTDDRSLEAAIAESDADPRVVPHDKVRTWLMTLANGDFDAPPPEPD